MTRNEKRRSDEMLKEGRDKADILHEIGSVVLRNTFTLDPAHIEDIYLAKYEPIFNGKSEDGTLTYDKKRLQTKGTKAKWRTAFIELIKDYLGPYGFLENKTINDAYALKSVKGCPMQPRHTDSAEEGSLRDAPRDTVPLAVLYALENNTRLQVWNFATGNSAVVYLNATDLIVFRGDAAHAGYRYDTQNVRLHAYIDSESVKRHKGKTFV